MVRTEQSLTVDLPTSATETQRRWTEEELHAARYRADPDADQLVNQVLEVHGDVVSRGRAAYNHLLELADKVAESPEILLLQSSNVMKQLQWYPESLVSYFEPIPAPDWVDAAKLERASELWSENILAVIVVLYAASLPACYLIRRGIPALYESSKLKNPRYISQRIYETGLFLEDVLSPGGLQLMSDIENLSLEEVREGAHLNPSSQRYLSGKGYLSAKKVRFLHASMRLMLTQPPERSEDHRHQALQPWDEAANGKPVNQEDLAYTLLTFGYLIPQGLAKWGCRWTPNDKEAFWHLWRVVGFVMGIEAALLPHSSAEAEQLYLMIRKQEAGASTQGQTLTASLIQFYEAYLPPGLANMIPPKLIQHQLGTPYDAMVLPPEKLQETRRFGTRLVFYALLGLIRLYYVIRNFVFRYSPTLAEFMGGVFLRAGDALIQSWRDVYVRRPFDVPKDATDWRPMAGVNEADLDRLQKWRNKLFVTIVIGIVLLVLSSLGLCATVVLWLLDAISQAKTAAWLTAGGFAAAIGVLKFGVPRVSRNRPKISK